MLKINKVSLKNFFSYGNKINEIGFNSPGTTLIKGENLDNATSGSNGAGKSTLISALSYALYDKCVSDVSKDNMINNINKKDMLVTVDFEKNNKIYHIERGRKIKGKGNYIQILENEKDITPDSISNANELLERIVGLPHELFTRIVVFSAINTSFLDLPVKSSSGPSQTSMIEHLFGLTLLTNKAEILKEHIKDTKNKIDGEQVRIDFLKKEHVRYNDQLETAKKRVLQWNDNNKIEVKKLKDSLSKMTEIDFDEQLKHFENLDIINSSIKECEFTIKELETAIANQEKHIAQIKTAEKRSSDWDIDTQTNIENLKSELDQLSSIDISAQKEILETLKTIKEDINTCNSTAKELISLNDKKNKEIQSNEKELSHLLDEKCPYCLQDFKEAKAKIEQCQLIINKNKEEIDKNSNDIKQIQEVVDKLLVVERDLTTKLVVKDLPTLIVMENKKSSVSNKLEDLQKATNPHLLSIEDLNKSTPLSKEELDILTAVLSEKKSSIIELRNTKGEISNKLLFKSTNEMMGIKNEKTTLESKTKDKELEQNPHIDALLELEKNKIEEINYDKINEQNKRLVHQDFLLKLLTKKDSFVRKFLLDKYLPFLNLRLQKYLSDLGLPHRVEFTNDLSARIIHFSRELDFGNLSHGQKSRINIALSMAFRDVLCHLHDKTNILLLDEVLDEGLDGIGVHSAASMLKKKAKEDELNMFIISHRDEISTLFDDMLVVQFKDGFSQIKD